MLYPARTDTRLPGLSRVVRDSLLQAELTVHSIDQFRDGTHGANHGNSFVVRCLAELLRNDALSFGYQSLRLFDCQLCIFDSHRSGLILRLCFGLQQSIER